MVTYWVNLGKFGKISKISLGKIPPNKVLILYFVFILLLNESAQCILKIISRNLVSKNCLFNILDVTLAVHEITVRSGSRGAATSKMECFVIITKHSILDVAAALDPPLTVLYFAEHTINFLPIFLWITRNCTPATRM